MKKVIISIGIFVLVLFFTSVVISRMGVMTTAAQYEKGGRYIALVGVPHIGTARYWEKIQRYLDRRECVIYEAVPDGSGLEPVMQPYKDLAGYMDLLYQGDALEYRDDWILSDVTIDDLKHLEKEIVEFSDMVQSFKGFPSFIVRWLFGIGMFFSSSDDPLVMERNEKPIREAIRQMENYQWIMIIYGQLHIPPMEQMLIQDGFREVFSEKCMDPYME